MRITSGMRIYVWVGVLSQLEHNCDKFLPDLDAVISCLKPCSQIPSNCFQRCAFHTDDISDKCHQQCATATHDGDDDTAGDQCYNRCYDNLLNEAMNKWVQTSKQTPTYATADRN